MAKNKISIAFCCLTLITTVGAEEPTAQKDAISIQPDTHMNIQNLLEEYLEDTGTPGAAVAYIEQGKTQLFCSGNMALNGKSVTEDTIFEIGSISKVFTTLALMDMVSRKEVNLDDPIEKYLPEMRCPELDGKKITLRHLATHTSGIPRMPNNFSPKDPSNPYHDYTAQCMYDYLQSCTLSGVPGDKFEYSNIGMGLLGHILSIQSKKSYEELIQTLIKKQLNMPNTMVRVNETRKANFSTGHHLMQPVSYWDLTGFAGAGALRSNIRDMANFLAANMGVLKSPLNQTMQNCHENQFYPMPGFAVGFGWMLSNSNSAEVIWHNGGTGGFRSYLGFNPKTQKGIVILSNSSDDWPDEFAQLMLDPDYKRPVIDKKLANSPEYLKQFAGSYEVVISSELPKQELQISVYGKQLASALSKGEVGMLYPESYGVFGVKGFPDGKVYCTFDDSGKISKIEARLLSSETLLWTATPNKAE